MPDTDTAVDVRGLVKTFGDVTALDGFDVQIATGKIHGLVGPNGAGKTTLLRVLFGLVTPDAGSIALLGREWEADGRTTMAGVGGFVEDPRFYPYLSARRNLELLAELDGASADRIDRALEAVRLTDRADRKVGGFSSGMRQRLGLASSLLRSPRLLLLDEPTVGLDPTGAREVESLVKGLAAEGVTVLISSHNMPELDGVCDGVTVMKEGRSVWHGSMDRLRSESPAPAHRMWTNDDHRAMEIAGADPAVTVVPDPEGGLTVHADRDALDAFVVALGRSGVAVRRLELSMTALESMFFALTGARSEPPAAGERPDPIEVTS
jgi:ABC-2 type transport system ATP-binding protein